MPSDEELRQYAEEALRWPEDFGYSGDLDLGNTWGFSPVSVHRDSDALQRSNFERIVEDMEKEFPDDVQVERSRHWAVGWIETMYVRVYDDQHEITPAFRRIVEIAEGLQNYPVYDDDDFSRREYEDDLDILQNAWNTGEVDGAIMEAVEKVVKQEGKDLYEELFSALWDSGRQEWGSRADGMWPSKQDWKEAIEYYWPEIKSVSAALTTNWRGVIDKALLLVPKKELSVESERAEVVEHLAKAFEENGMTVPAFEIEFWLSSPRLRGLSTYHVDERETIATVVEEEILNLFGA